MDRSHSMACLVGAFRDSLLAMLPIAERLSIRWREPDNYDDWDAIAAGLFEGLVLVAVRSSQEFGSSFPLCGYDERISNYGARSFVAAVVNGAHHPLVCLQTSQSPFDTCLLARMGERDELVAYFQEPLSDCRFAVLVRGDRGSTTLVESISFEQ